MATPQLLALRQQLDSLAAAFETTVALTEQLADDPEAREYLDLLREARGLVQTARSRRRSPVALAPALPPPPAALPSKTTEPDLAWDAAMDALDKEEREERELAARRAQFLLGAEMDDEQLDWSESMGGAGSDDEMDGAGLGSGGDRDAEDAARRVLATATADGDGVAEPAKPEPTWADLDGFVPPGHAGFTQFAQAQMRAAGVPSNPRVLPAPDLAPSEWAAGPVKPRLQPYQETVAYLCRPQSIANPRMLVVHRTGAGKTATMIQIADNFFNDRRPKLIIFPTTAVCNSFYRELRNPHFPNRYASYLGRGGFPDAKKALELTGILRNGAVLPEFLHAADLPSAPLRAFSYTQAGGAASCGQRPNAVFKCPDGYAGSYPERLAPIGGYADFECKYNPFSNKVVLMDEVHNLVRPSVEILRNERRMLMLQRLRQLLRTAENSVIIGLSGTPLCDVPAEAQALQNLIKGRLHQQLNDEGFVSYYMQTPLSVFPLVKPLGMPSVLPAAALRRVPLRNLLAPPAPPSGKGRRRALPPPVGNRHEYEAKVGDEDVHSLDPIRLSILSRLCSVAQTAGYAGRDDVARMVHGAKGKLLKRDVADDAFGSDAQRARARGYCSKLHQIVEDVVGAVGGGGGADGDDGALGGASAPASSPLKTLVIIHRNAGYKLLLRMLARRLGEGRVRGFPAARTYAEKRDATLAPLLGFPHDEARGRDGGCPCALCSFNRGDSGANVMVADAKECGEGVSFFGVRRLILADVPGTAEDMLQRVGRAVRFMGHAALPEADRDVDVRLYVATLKGGTTVDEVLVERLVSDLGEYGPELEKLQAKAVDANMWEQDEGADAALAAADGEAICETAEAVLSESDDEPPPPPPEEVEPESSKPTPKARKPRKAPATKAKSEEALEVSEAAADDVPPPDVSGLEAALETLKVSVDDREAPGDKENAVQKSPRKSPARSPAKGLSPGRSPGRALDSLPQDSPVGAVAPRASPDTIDYTARAPPKPLTAKPATAAGARKKPAAAAKPRRPAAAKRLVKDAKRSDDESEDSDMDGWIAKSDEEDEESGGGSAESSDEASGEESSDEWSADDSTDDEDDEEEEDDDESNDESSDDAEATDSTAGNDKQGANSTPPPPPPPPPPVQPVDSDDDILVATPEEATPTAARRRLMKVSAQK